MLDRSASDHGRTSSRSRMHIVISLRSVENPECISAEIDRAHARAAGSDGHMPGCRSARYSAIAHVSQTTEPLPFRHGTYPDREYAPRAGRGHTPARSPKTV